MKGVEQMDFEEPITKKRSLGALRKAEKTKPRSPDLVGVLALQRHTFETIAKQFEETDAEELLVCIAGWPNEDANGEYLSVEVSPRYVKRAYRPFQRSKLSIIFGDHEENA
jgi:hypothetical protein